MEMLQWGFISVVAITIISLIFVIYFLFSFIRCGKKIKKTDKMKSKGKKQKKRKRKKIDSLKRQRKGALKAMFIFLVLGIFSGIGSGYISYYQETHLSETDMTNISEGYYYLHDLKTELENIEAGKEVNQGTIDIVATSLASYRLKRASSFNTIDGQMVLNRYYNAMSELGVNISRNIPSLSTNPTVLKEAISDVEKVQNYQTKALEFFKVDKKSLESNA